MLERYYATLRVGSDIHHEPAVHAAGAGSDGQLPRAAALRCRLRSDAANDLRSALPRLKELVRALGRPKLRPSEHNVVRFQPQHPCFGPEPRHLLHQTVLDRILVPLERGRARARASQRLAGG